MFLGGPQNEDQAHIFKVCPILSSCHQYHQYKRPKTSYKVFFPIEKRRKQFKENIPPGDAARTQAEAPNISA